MPYTLSSGFVQDDMERVHSNMSYVFSECLLWTVVQNKYRQSMTCVVCDKCLDDQTTEARIAHYDKHVGEAGELRGI